MGENSDWRFRRVLARVEPLIEPVLAHHATEYWHLPLRRKETDGAVRWSIDGDPLVELRVADQGASTLVVFDFSLYEPVKKVLRTRHIDVRHATGLDFARSSVN